MKWRLECQSCQHANIISYGMCLACDKDQCEYLPYQTTATSNFSTDWSQKLHQKNYESTNNSN